MYQHHSPPSLSIWGLFGLGRYIYSARGRVYAVLLLHAKPVQRTYVYIDSQPGGWGRRRRFLLVLLLLLLPPGPLFPAFTSHIRARIYIRGVRTRNPLGSLAAREESIYIGFALSSARAPALFIHCRSNSSSSRLWLLLRGFNNTACRYDISASDYLPPALCVARVSPSLVNEMTMRAPAESVNLN